MRPFPMTVIVTFQTAESKRVPTIVALTGFMGSGKTSTGRALAESLGWAFVDLDEEIEKQGEVAIRELFRERGETAFREIEHEALRRCVAQCSGPTILALGGGAYVQPQNVDLLREFQVRAVFLETLVEEMLQRCGVEDNADPENPRPLAADSAAFRRLYEERLPSYRAAHLTIGTSGKTVSQVASEIVEKLQLAPCRG
jgi:shikimate kinase